MAKKRAAKKATGRSLKKSSTTLGANFEVRLFKVALMYEKRIWRRIALLEKQTLDDLHLAIFGAFDRFDEHLYSFFFPFPGAKLEPWPRAATEYSCAFNCEDPGPFREEPLLNAEETTLDSLDLSKGQKFLYLFDFGDEWWHEITYEDRAPRTPRMKYPRVMESRGESPPQYVYDDDDE